MKKKLFSVVAVLVLTAILTVALVACMPSDYTKAHKNLKEEGYSVASYDTNNSTGKVFLAAQEKAISLVYDVNVTLTAYVTASKDNGENFITVWYCSSNDEAKALHEKVKAGNDKYLAELETEYKKGEITKEEYNNKKSATLKYGRQGTIVYRGTADAVKAAK